jgi:hypothetical protein
MRRISIIVLVAFGLSAVGMALAFAIGIPEVDRANATLALDPIGKLKKTTCVGEDAVPYVTFRGRWEGSETDVTPGSTDYDLGGALVVSRAVWTINLATQRGVLRAHISVFDPISGDTHYAGRLTMITQGLPDPKTPIEARGWIDAATFIDNVPDGGSLLANIEAQFDQTFNGRAEFGDVPPNFGFPDYSATTINQNC